MQVRYQRPQIDLALVQEAMDKRTLGLSMGLLGPSEAKARLARVHAGRAVGFALTPGVPPLEVLSIAPRGAVLTRLAFAPQVCCDSTPTCTTHRSHQVPTAP